MVLEYSIHISAGASQEKVVGVICNAVVPFLWKNIHHILWETQRGQLRWRMVNKDYFSEKQESLCISSRRLMKWLPRSSCAVSSTLSAHGHSGTESMTLYPSSSSLCQWKKSASWVYQVTPWWRPRCNQDNLFIYAIDFPINHGNRDLRPARASSFF